MGLTKKIKKYLAGAAFAGAVLASQPDANADETRQPPVQQIQRAAINSMRDKENSILPAAGIQLVKPIEGFSLLTITPMPEFG